MTAELLGRGTGTATLRYRQSSLCLVFGFHISAPGNPGNIMSTIWIQELGRRKASLVPDQLKKMEEEKEGIFLASLERCGHNNKDLKIWGSMATAIGIQAGVRSYKAR